MPIGKHLVWILLHIQAVEVFIESKLEKVSIVGRFLAYLIQVKGTGSNFFHIINIFDYLTLCNFYSGKNFKSVVLSCRLNPSSEGIHYLSLFQEFILTSSLSQQRSHKSLLQQEFSMFLPICLQI